MTNEIDNDISDLDSDDDGAMSFRQIMNMLVQHQEIILTVPKDSIPQIKRNLTALKSKDAAKLKNAGLLPADDVLSYTELPAVEGQAPEDVRFHIRLAPRKNVVVKKIELPDNTI